MKTQITATAPTNYQLRSIRAFCMPVTKQPNGSYKAIKEFNSKKDAIKFLKDRAQICFESNNEFKAAISDMLAYNQMTIDAVTAYIETI